MNARRLQPAAGLLLVAVSFVAGLAWRECMLPAIGGFLAYRLFLLRMDQGAPWPTLRAALDALSGGALVAAVGLALLLEVGLAWWGWWQPAEPHPWPTLLVLGAAAASCSLARNATSESLAELRTWTWVFAGVLLALVLQRAGWSIAPCVLATSVGVTMVWVGWQLAAVTAMALLRAGSDRT